MQISLTYTRVTKQVMNATKTILIADDDEDIAYVVKFILEREGYRVLHVADGSVIEKLALCKPHLIIMDWNLGGTNGGNLCREIKQNKETSHIQVVLFSASDDLKHKAATCNADDYLNKPFDLTALVNKVGKLLTTHQVAC